MITYTVIVKKGGIEFSYSGADREFITSQIDLLFVKLKGGPLYDTSSAPQIDIEAKEKTELNQQKEIVVEKEVEKNIEEQKEKEEITEKTIEEKITEVTNSIEVENQAKEEVFVEKTNDEVLDNLFEEVLLEENNSLQQKEVIEEDIEEEENLLLQENVEKADDILPQDEKIEQEFIHKNLDEVAKSSEEDVQEEVVVEEDFEEEIKPCLDSFENILDAKMNDEAYLEETEEERPKKYEDVVKNIKKDNLLDYLIITAYYLLENEKMESFQLKQLNSKLFSSMNLMINRKTVQKAIEDGLLVVVSDDADDSGIIRYSLSLAGREYYLNADI